MSNTNGVSHTLKTHDIFKTWNALEKPVAQVTGGAVRSGVYRTLAVLGWIEKKPNELPKVGIQTIILKTNEDKHVGALTLGLPVTPKTERYINALLQTYGWDGRVWPHDEDGGWPEGSADRDQILGLLDKVNLDATLTFAPGPKGVPAVRMNVTKSRGPFQLSPFDEIDSPPLHLLRFRDLVTDPTIFFPMKPRDVPG